MRPTLGKEFERRFRQRVLLPAAVVLALTATLAVAGLFAAGRSTDSLSLMAQRSEVWRAIGDGLNELSVAQESVGLCSRCVEQAASPAPDREWLHDNVGQPLFALYGAHETYILDPANRPLYASVQGRQVPLSTHGDLAPPLDRLVQLARGEVKRPTGKSGLNERLPGAPPELLTFPAVDGISDEPITLFPTVRTTPAVVHATELVRIGDRVAFASAMPMARFGSGEDPDPAARPVLVSLRYLDGQFLQEAARTNHLIDGRLADSGEPAEGETTAPLMNSDGEVLTTFYWKPLLGGGVVVRDLLPPALGLFAVIALLLFIMSMRIRILMERDEHHLGKLKQAHLELEAKEAQAHHLAYHDMLTGLPNRALFNDNADQALLRASESEPVAIALLDLDRFKDVNDRFGHLAGDELIREVGLRLSRLLSAKDAIARLGGDEFAFLLKGEDIANGVEPMLERILDALNRPYEVLGNEAHIGASMGVACAPQYGIDRTELMRKADIALYQAKEQGRDCYSFFTDSMDESVQLRAVLERDLRAALATGKGLTLHYQPLVDARRASVTGFEALIRWEHEERGTIAPQLFLPVAEETGLISALDDWVVSESCKVAREWPKMTIAINLSPVQFCHADFAERVCTIVREAGVMPHQIEFEVTEGVVLDQNDSVRAALRRLRSEGFRIALDDFGTGYSSLNYLREFEVDRIKIDKSFVHSLGRTMDANAIITAVVTLGHAMGLQVTAEGVETAEQETFLRAAGCNMLQGFRFSKPVPADRLGEWLRDHAATRKAA